MSDQFAWRPGYRHSVRPIEGGWECIWCGSTTNVLAANDLPGALCPGPRVVGSCDGADVVRVRVKGEATDDYPRKVRVEEADDLDVPSLGHVRGPDGCSCGKKYCILR